MDLPVSLWALKLSKRGARYTKATFSDLPTALLWLRLAIAVVCGVVCGISPLTGWTGFVIFGVLAVGAVTLLLGPAFLDIDYDDFSQQELMGEGLMPAFGVFMVRLGNTQTTLTTCSPASNACIRCSSSGRPCSLRSTHSR